MNCKQVQNIIFKYIEGDLHNLEKKHFEDHIFECNSCKLKYYKLESAMNIFEAYSESQPQISPFFTEKVIHRIHQSSAEELNVFQWVKEVFLKRKIIIASFFLSVLSGIFIGNLLKQNVNANNSEAKEINIEDEYWAGISEKYMTLFFNNLEK